MIKYSFKKADFKILTKKFLKINNFMKKRCFYQAKHRFYLCLKINHQIGSLCFYWRRLLLGRFRQKKSLCGHRQYPNLPLLDV